MYMYRVLELSRRALLSFIFRRETTTMTTGAASPAAAAVVFPWLLRPAPSLDIIGSGQRKQMAHALRPVPESLHQLLPLLTDTHAHTAGYGDEARDSFAKDTRQNGARVPDLNAREYVVVSVEPSDWKYCDEETCTKPTGQGMGGVRPALGIHPQCADEVDNPEPSSEIDDTWLSELRSCLLASPWSIVGECGLDNNGSYRHAFETHQMPIFRHHLRLAAELNRPISVHSVKADGALVDMLIEEVDMGNELPPTVCLHSFSGSIETLKRIVNVVEGRPWNKKERLRRGSIGGRNEDIVRVFVGFNAWTNLYKKQASRLVNGLVNDTPLGEYRLLIESDWNPIDFDFEGSDRRDSDKILMNGLLDLSDMLGWEPARTAEVLSDNTARFLEPVGTGVSSKASTTPASDPSCRRTLAT